jgi:hypothetical protein
MELSGAKLRNFAWLTKPSLLPRPLKNINARQIAITAEYQRNSLDIKSVNQAASLN